MPKKEMPKKMMPKKDMPMKDMPKKMGSMDSKPAKKYKK